MKRGVCFSDPALSKVSWDELLFQEQRKRRWMRFPLGWFLCLFSFFRGQFHLYLSLVCDIFQKKNFYKLPNSFSTTLVFVVNVNDSVKDIGR